MNQVTAVQFLQQVAENKVDFNICTLDKGVIAKDIQPQKKNSASDTKTYFAELVSAVLGQKELPVVAKVFIDNKNNYHMQALKYEAKVYKYILDKIIKPGYSPNFIPFVGYAECPYDKNIFLDRTAYTNFLISLERKPSHDNVGIILTERAGNGAQFQIPSTSRIVTPYKDFDQFSTASQAKILFQIIYSLEVMQRFRIVHNDFHAANVLIARFDTEIELGFEISETQRFQFKTKYIPYLFDWDFAFVEKLGPNPKIKGFTSLYRYAFNNNFSSRRDLYTFFCTLQFGGDIGKKFGTVLSLAKESKDYSLIPTKLQLHLIKQYRPIGQSGDNMVYKFSGRQFNEIFNEKIRPVTDPDKHTVRIVDMDEGGLSKHTLYFPQGFHLSRQQLDRLQTFESKQFEKTRLFKLDAEKVNFLFNTKMFNPENEKVVECYYWKDAKLEDIVKISPIPIKPINVAKLVKNFEGTIEGKNKIFNLTIEQFDKYFAQIPLFDNAASVMIEVRQNLQGTHNIVLFNPFTCRMTNITADLPTPMDLLTQDFSALQVKEITAKFRYRLPEVNEGQYIYIDPQLQNRGRAKIEGVPRFSQQQSGYVGKKYKQPSQPVSLPPPPVPLPDEKFMASLADELAEMEGEAGGGGSAEEIPMKGLYNPIQQFQTVIDNRKKYQDDQPIEEGNPN